MDMFQADRIRRMKGLTVEEEQNEKNKRKHMSADDLDDGYIFFLKNLFIFLGMNISFVV